MPGFDDELETRHARRDDLRLSLVQATAAVVAGPDAGLSVEVGAGGVVVGTGALAELRLSDPLVSRAHLRLRAGAEGVVVEDLGSLNGTFLDRMRLREATLSEDAVLSAGDTTIELRFAKDRLDLPLSERTTFGGAIGQSPAMRHVFALLEAAAQSDVTVLLEGDSGVGKDVLAHALHQEGPRRDGPFVVLDCGAIPPSLVEAELFGHEKGAFTGAVAMRPGAFEQAHGGTLFLDEIGELPLEAQPKLLRALESRAFRRVGGTSETRVDVRVIAATNRRLREAVRNKEFRQDLYYRLAVVHVAVPRLAQRREDILPIAESFLRRQRPDATLPPDLARLLLGYDWPGNARELRNVVERFATFGDARHDLLFGASEDLAQTGAASAFEGLERLPYHDAKRRLIEDFHRVVLPRVVERAGGSVGRAAELLELPRGSLYRMLKEIERDPT